MFTGVPADESLAAELLRVTSGNPLFVREVLQLGSDRRRPLSASPAGLRDVIGRRLAWLPLECREALAIGAVVGNEFPLRLLEAVSGQTRATLTARLDDAVSRRLVERIEAESPRYRFTHPLLREVLYRDLDADLQERLHHRVGCAIERVLTDDPDARDSQVAHHLRRAGRHVDPALAMAAARLAGEAALRRAAYELAIDHLADAVLMAETGPVFDPVTVCELLLLLARAQMASGHAVDARATCGRVAALSRAHGLPRLLAAAALTVQAGTTYGVVDELEIRMLEEALEAVGSTDSPERTRLLARLAVAVHATASVERRVSLCDEALAIARRLDDQTTLAEVLFDRHWSLFAAERAEIRLATSNEIVALATRIHDDRLAMAGRALRIGNLLELGEMDSFAQGVTVYERVTDELRQPQYRWRVALLRSTQHLLQGRLAEAESGAREGLDLGLLVEYEPIWVYYGSVLAVIRYLQGRLRELEPVLTEMAARYPAIPDWQAAAAAALVEGGRTAEARTVFERLAADDFSALRRGFVPIYTLALLPLRLPPALGSRQRLEPPVLGEGQEGGVEHDLVAAVPQHRCRQVVDHQGRRHSTRLPKRPLQRAEQHRLRLADRELQVGPA